MSYFQCLVYLYKWALVRVSIKIDLRSNKLSICNLIYRFGVLNLKYFSIVSNTFSLYRIKCFFNPTFYEIFLVPSAAQGEENLDCCNTKSNLEITLKSKRIKFVG